MSRNTSGSNRSSSLSEIAKLGFESLADAKSGLGELASKLGVPEDSIGELFSLAGSPDRALANVMRIAEQAPTELKALLKKAGGFDRLVRLVGSSDAVADYFCRLPIAMDFLSKNPPPTVPNIEPLSTESREVLRSSYRSKLAQIADWDLSQADPESGLVSVMEALSDLADAALEAGVIVARSELIAEGRITIDASRGTELAVISMGKCGARELNYVSDVDVIYVCSGESPQFLDTATKIAQRLALVINESGIEPGLWEVDPNLRPEGKSGALVRTVEAHVSYYEKWAKSWEFQALLKARFSAGSKELGLQYLSQVTPLIWSRQDRSNIVQDARAMRKRVIENIPADERDRNLKLGRGGLRDVEFTIQLLQLVHGVTDANLRSSSTFDAMQALATAGLLSRQDASDLNSLYRQLRIIEHRLQLVKLRRTHLVPTDSTELRRIARGINPKMSAEMLNDQWLKAKLRITALHESVFYRPLLAATAELDAGHVSLSTEAIENRLSSLGFLDPAGANRHIRALSQGVSRRATIQRTLLPVLISWMADGVYPDRALLSFRRLSEQLGDTHWFLKMLRDSSGAAERLMRVLSSSNFIARLLEYTPESSFWLGDEGELQPSSYQKLENEVKSILSRTADVDKAAESIRLIRRRETLRTAIAATTGLTSLGQISLALTEITEVYLDAMLCLALRTSPEDIDISIIAMGRLGGREQGFGSDADVMFVYQNSDSSIQSQAESVIAKLIALAKDPILDFQLDLDLRPEGKNGPRIKSLAAYSGYYEKWAETWEFQALLRARAFAGSAQLRQEFTKLIDGYRYPESLKHKQLVDIRLMKARVESERLPQGADSTRHLKLGKGALSDIEWLVQFMQLQHVGKHPEVALLGTLESLERLEHLGFVNQADAVTLREAWLLCSRIRSAQVLAYDKATDQLPVDREALEAIARILEYPAGSASELEEHYLASTRKARVVFERLFFE